MGELTDKVIGFYTSDDFLSFYTHKLRLKEIKQILTSKKTSAGDKINLIKYLDAHKGDVPKEGRDSGNLTVNLRMILTDDD